MDILLLDHPSNFPPNANLNFDRSFYATCLACRTPADVTCLQGREARESNDRYVLFMHDSHHSSLCIWCSFRRSSDIYEVNAAHAAEPFETLGIARMKPEQVQTR
jgi:hypothetical protein